MAFQDNEWTNLQKNMGKKSAVRLLSVLGKGDEFVAALNSDIGTVLLKDLYQMIEDVVDDYLNGNMSEENMLKGRIARDLIMAFSKKISDHAAQLNVYKEKSRA